MTETLRQVGIDLQESEENRALVEAIMADNPELTIRHLPGLVPTHAVRHGDDDLPRARSIQRDHQQRVLIDLANATDVGSGTDVH